MGGVAAVVAAACLVVLLVRPRRGLEVSALQKDLERLAERVSADTASLAGRLEGIDTRLSRGQIANQDLAQGIFETLGDVRRTTSLVAEQAKEFTGLQDLLRAPTARGALGEAMLEELLRQVLPPTAYEMQHRFKDGRVVDAVVKAGGRIVCIDSKFPLANHQRIVAVEDPVARASAEKAFAADVSRHINNISTRYIAPDEGTFDFAVMYVPAEGVYAEVLRSKDGKQPIFETAIASRVVPMSPLTLFGYLQTVLYGLKCLQIEEHAEEVLGFCGRLQQEMTRFAEDYEVLGRHLSNARGKHEDGSRRLDRVRDRLDQVSSFGQTGENEARLEVVND